MPRAGDPDVAGSARPVVAIVDDHQVLASALARVLASAGFPTPVVVDAATVDLVGAIAAARPDKVLLDYDLGPGGDSVRLILPLVDRGIDVLVLTGYTSAVLVARCLSAGATAVFDKTGALDDLLDYLTTEAGDRAPVEAGTVRALGGAARSTDDARRARSRFDELTPRERMVLGALLGGHTPPDIARREYISITTVRTHIRAILRKLGVNSQLAAVALAHAVGWEPQDRQG